MMQSVEERSEEMVDSTVLTGRKRSRGSIGIDGKLLGQGAEAVITQVTFLGREAVVKERFKKDYRHPTLDKILTSRRLTQEVRAMVRCRKLGIATPCIYHVDGERSCIYMEYLSDASSLKDVLSNGNAATDEVCKRVGSIVGKLHDGNLVHGDLTTSNVMVRKEGQIVLIDFGLSYTSSAEEDKAVDLYVLERAVTNAHSEIADSVNRLLLEGYRQSSRNSKVVLRRLEEVRLRGRKRLMVG